MDQDTPSGQRPNHWRMNWLIGCHLAAALLLGSWLWAPTRSVWDWVDERIFLALNGTLAWGEQWQWIWAVWNTGKWDTVSGVIMIGLLMVYMFGYRPRLRQRMAEAAFIGLTILAIVMLFREVIFEIWSITRHSPSLVIDEAYRLSELVPGIRAKDQATDSFPGNHGIVCFTFITLMWRFTNWRYASVATVLGIWYVLPRMLGGAHWFTDIAVGSAALALVTMSWVLATPLERRARYYLLLGIDAVGRRIPMFQRDPLPDKRQ